MYEFSVKIITKDMITHSTELRLDIEGNIYTINHVIRISIVTHDSKKKFEIEFVNNDDTHTTVRYECDDYNIAIIYDSIGYSGGV